VTAGCELLGDMTADEPSATCDENVHSYL